MTNSFLKNGFYNGIQMKHIAIPEIVTSMQVEDSVLLNNMTRDWSRTTQTVFEFGELSVSSR